MNNTDYSEKHTRWSTSNNGKVIPFSDCNLPTEFVMEHVKGAIIVGGSLLLPICYDMSSVIDYYKSHIKEVSQEFEISGCIIYKHLVIPTDFILENFPYAEIYYSRDGKKVLKLPSSCKIEDIVVVYKAYLVSSIVESL